MGKGTARTETFLTPKLMCLLLSQQPWQRSCVGACVLVPQGVWMTQFLPSPHTQVTLPNHTWNQKIGWPAALSAHTKDNSSFQPQMWPCGLGCSCPLFPIAMPPPPSWGCLPSRLAGFLLNRARRRLWASVLRNWGMPSFALERPRVSSGSSPTPGAPEPLPFVQVSFPAQAR